MLLKWFFIGDPGHEVPLKSRQRKHNTVNQICFRKIKFFKNQAKDGRGGWKQEGAAWGWGGEGAGEPKPGCSVTLSSALAIWGVGPEDM